MNDLQRVVPHSQSEDAPNFALDQAYFTAPEWYRRDIDLVFKARWLFVDHSSRLQKAGDFVAYGLDRESVLIARGADGRINAFHNSCRHRGSRICSQSSGNARAFMCPYHNWTYNLDGSLRAAPRMVGIDKADYPAVPVWVEEWNGMIFINLSVDKPQTVSRYLAGMDLAKYALQRTKVVHDRTYTVASNWKLAAETYNECYHCANTHPTLCSLIDPLKDLEAWDDANAGDDYAIFAADMRDAIIKPGVKTFSMDGALECTKPLGDTGDWHDAIAALSWYPQFGMFVYPDHAVTYSWKPISENQTLFRSTWLVHEDAQEGVHFDLARLIEFGDLTNEEDTVICENAQLGIQSAGYRPGPYHPVFEGPLRGFNKVYLNQVGRDPDAGRVR